jgi:MscS family membrane protein
MVESYSAGRRRHWTAATCTCVVVVLSASAVHGAAQSPPAAATVDPYGRETPRGTVAGFTFAAHSGDVESATRYLQLTADQRADAPALVQALESLINRYFTSPLVSMSASREGVVRDGLPLDRERLPLAVGARTVDILLVRVDDPTSGPIWLFSSESLARMASLAPDATWAERVMPQMLVRHSVFGLSLAQWTLWSLSSIGLLLALLALSVVGRHLMKRRQAGAEAAVDPWFRDLRWPAIVATTILVHLLIVPWLGIAFTVRITYTRWLFAALVLVSAWLVWRFLGLSFERARHVATRRHQAGAVSLMLLVERVVKAAVILVVILGLLKMAGLDMTTALAGVGLGGIALALGAQKSVENLLGGVFLLADGAIAVGDFCTISNRSGWVEDITLRSVRIRTVEQTVVSIPAGILAQTTVENFVTRGKMLIQTTLLLQYGTTAAQVEAVLASDAV